MSECFTDILGWTDTKRHQVHAEIQPFYGRGGPTRGEVPLRKTESIRDKSNNELCKYGGELERRLVGSLPARMEGLVLTCRTHTPGWNTRDMSYSETCRDWASLYFVPSPESTEDAGLLYVPLIHVVCPFYAVATWKNCVRTHAVNPDELFYQSHTYMTSSCSC